MPLEEIYLKLNLIATLARSFNSMTIPLGRPNIAKAGRIIIYWLYFVSIGIDPKEEISENPE